MSELTHGTPFEAPELEEVARLFPSYEILGLIACGGMGAVYHAVQTSLERPVAIKILPRVFSTNEEFRKGFESEAKAMAKLNHQNLIGVYDFGEVGGLLFIVMEFVAGQSLHQAAHGCAVEHADAINLVIGVCDGLAHAHEFGILHRDIKPSNILLDSQMNPKIGDFGLARPLERQIEEGEQIFGTPGYTAPEVLRPPFTIDQRADIFSVGVMLHELLTGHLLDAAPRPASQICGCNPRLDAVIMRATDPNPNRRYMSAMELGKELVTIAAIPNRTLRTGVSEPRIKSMAGASTFSKPVFSALSRPTAASLKPKEADSPGQQKRIKPAKTLSKESSGTGLVIFLVAALIVVFIAFLTIKGNQAKAPVPDSPPTTAAKEKTRPLPSAGPVEDEVAEPDPADVLRRIRSSIRTRVAPSLERHRLELKDNLENYQKAMESAAEGLSLRDRERISETLSENLQIWEGSGHKLPETLPTGFGVVEGAGDIHASYLGKQVAIQRDLEREIASLASVYVLELQNQIEQIGKDGNARAVDVLEEEVRAVEGNLESFREKISE